MSTAAVPIAVFGDLDADIWGVVVGGEEPRAAVAGLTDADVTPGPASLDLEDREVWILNGAGCALRIERADATAATPAGERTLEPCRVSGSATIGGVEREFDVGGLRSPALSVDGLDSLRLLGSWFPAGHEIGLLSARPKGARGHDRDAVGVVARGEEHAVVVDPRLSTTYDQHGEPRRVGVELWLGDTAEDDAEQWPRRVAGAATGSHVTTEADGAGLDAYALRCISRAENGAGVYVLLAGRA